MTIRVMPAFTPRAMPDDLARLYVLEATIEILKTENEILKRRLAAAETWAAQAVITKRLDTLAADRLDALAARRAEPGRSLLRYWFFGRYQEGDRHNGAQRSTQLRNRGVHKTSEMVTSAGLSAAHRDGCPDRALNLGRKLTNGTFRARPCTT